MGSWGPGSLIVRRNARSGSTTGITRKEIHKWTVGTTSDPPNGAEDNASLRTLYLDKAWRKKMAAEASLTLIKDLESKLRVALCCRPAQSAASVASCSNNNSSNNNSSFAQWVVNGDG